MGKKNAFLFTQARPALRSDYSSLEVVTITMMVTKTIMITISGISNGNRTEWSPIRSLIIRVITKSDDRAAGVRFVYHEYDYRPNWTTRSPITN